MFWLSQRDTDERADERAGHDWLFFRYGRWPSDEMVNSITALHPEMTSKKIKLWFEDRRKTDPGHKA